MNLIACCDLLGSRKKSVAETWRIMKLIAIFMLAICLNANAKGYSQKLTLSQKNVSLEKIFKEIGRQSGYTFVYTKSLLQKAKKITISITNAPLQQVLEECFKDQSLTFSILDKIIVIKEKEEPAKKEGILNAPAPPVTIIKGKVTDENGNPVSGATVQLKNSSKGTATASNGEFQLAVPDNSAKILVFTFVGMQTQEVNAEGKTAFNIILKKAISQQDEVVVVGYGTQRKATVTGSVSSVRGDDLKQSSSANVSNSLAGRIPGVIANNRSGRPGDDASNILIRGLNSFGGGTQPLVVVDGIPDRDLNRINPDDIDNITILKDASAAIYGVRSANGVILITTKRGKSGKPAIRYDGSVGQQQLTRIDKHVNAWEYMTYYNELNINQGNTAPYTQEEINKYKSGDPEYKSTDWLRAVFRKNAPQTNHSLSASGGNEQVKYFISGQYLDQQSNFRNSDEDYKQYNIRSNLDINVASNLKVNMDIAARKENRMYPVWNINNILHEAVSLYPFLPDYWSNGYPSAGISNGRNPAILTSSLPGYDRITNLIVNPKVGFDLQMPFITKGLSLSGYAAFDYNLSSEKKFTKPWDAYTYDRTTKTYNNQRSTTSITSITQNEQSYNQNTYFLKLSFDRQFGRHSINAFAGYEQNSSSLNVTSAYRRNLLSEQLDQIFTGSTEAQNATGSAAQDGRESYLGRVGYNYDNRYLVDVSFRYNGSFNFSHDKRWGLFPALSLGWRVSEENFFRNNIKFIQQLKLRGSWGLMGSDAVSQYLYLTRYQIVTSPSNYTYFGSDYNLASAIYFSSTPNPYITWEKQDSKNIGLDATLLSNRLNVSFDAFRFYRKDILATRNASVPLYTGLSLPAENIGKSLNKGFDFSAIYNERRSALKYNIGFNFTYAKSKIIFRDESPNIPQWQKSTGYAIDSWLVYETNGIYHTADEVNKSPHLAGATAGDLWIKDHDNDGQITANDMVRIPESATPKIVYGITMGTEYKGLALSLVWSGQSMARQMILSQMEGSIAAPPQWMYDQRWTADNPGADYPKAFNGNDRHNNVYADFWLRDASFLRLKSAELSYSFPAQLLSKYGVSNLRVYAGGFNLLSFDKMKKFNVDPETTNITGINYPQTRICRLGVNIGLR